ncbi:MAG: Hpt domain-containing protein [Myxococcota bacterium]
MGLDMAKYRRIFLEEAADHLGEISHSLLQLEKELGSVEAIDTIFRMAHSIKSMAASLGYDSVADLSHKMEDRMEHVRTAGCVRSQDELALLFRALEALEAMVEAVGSEQEPAPAEESLLAALAEIPESGPVPAPGSEVESAAALAPEPVGGEPKKVRS